MHKVQMNSSEQVRVVGTVTIYSDFVDFKKSVSEQLLQNVVGSRAKLKFKWLSDNKVEVRTTCSAADAHKIELLIESCEVTKMVAWSSSANSNRKVSDKVMRKVQMNSSAGCDDYVKLSTATLKRKLKNATPEEKKCIQAELNARGVYSKRSVNSAETSSVGPCFAVLWPAYIDDEYKCACCGKRFPAGHNSVSLGGHKPDGMHFIFEYTKENRVGNSVNYDPYKLPPEDSEGGIFKVIVGEDADEEGYRWLNFCRNCWPKLTSMSPEEIYAKYSPSVNSSKSCNSSATRYLDKNGIMGVPGEEWTYKELAEYWDNEQMNDPVMSEYASFEDWVEDAISNMVLLDSSRKLNSANDPESPFYTATDAAYYFLDKDFTLDQIEQYLKRKGYSDEWIRRMFDLMDEYADEQEDFDMFNSSRKRMNSSRKKKLNSSVESQVWYHVSPDTIDSFDVAVSKEIGLHCGITPESGLRRYPNGYIYEVTVTPGIRCAELPDEIDFWASFDTPRLLQKAGYADDKAVENLKAKLRTVAGDSDKNRKYSKIIRDYLLSLGYSAFTYTNTKEVKERCICIFDSAVVQDMRDVTADYKSQAKPESQFQSPTDAAIFFNHAGYSDERVERELKDAGYSDRYIQRVLDVLGELASAESDDTLNSSIRTNSNRKVGNSSMRKVIFRGKLNSSRKRMNSSRNLKYTAYAISDLGALEDEWGYGPGELVDVVKQGEKAVGGKFLGFTNDDNMYFVFEEDGTPVAYEQSHDRWFPVNSSRKRMNSSRRKRLNSSEDDVTADDEVQDTGIDGGDTATETAELLDDALIVQNPETKEVSLFVATEDDEVLPESVDVIAEVTPVVEGAVLDSSRRLKRFTAAKLNSSKGCLNSDAEDVCPACGKPADECTCEPGTVAYDEIQLPDDTVVEVENILVVQGEDDDLGLFLPETADEAVPAEYEVVAVANPVAEAEVLDSSRRLKK